MSDMENKKFLTVMAVFDGDTQARLDKIQRYITSNVAEGTQTMEIPFHITLGSYPTDDEQSVVDKIKRVAENTYCFDVQLTRYNHFGNRVMYVEPQICDGLVALRTQFENDYAHGFEWIPHATLYCGEEGEVIKARGIAPASELPIDARIVGIELGEFFPTRKIIRVSFKERERV